MATYKRGCRSFNWLAIAASNAPKIENTNVTHRATSIRRLRASADLDHKDWRSAVSVNAVIFRVPHERAVADTMRANPRVHPELLVWFPNVLFIVIGAFLFRRLSKQ